MRILINSTLFTFVTGCAAMAQDMECSLTNVDIASDLNPRATLTVRDNHAIFTQFWANPDGESFALQCLFGECHGVTHSGHMVGLTGYPKLENAEAILVAYADKEVRIDRFRVDACR